MDDMIERAKVLSSATRVNLWMSISSEGSTPTELANTLGLAPSSITHHLKVLKDAGLIDVQRKGRYRIYRGTGVAMTIATADELEATYGSRPDVSP